MSEIDKIIRGIAGGRKYMAILIDPDKASEEQCLGLISRIPDGAPVVFLVGGSLLLDQQLEQTVSLLKQHSTYPVFLFPGNALQLTPKADGLLMLSLISGRNPEFLIGQHVTAAPAIRQMGLSTIPTAYMLIDGGVPTSVSYMSNTTPMPANKPDIAACTAMAGEMLGLRLLYLEAGSGALYPVPPETVRMVRKSVSIPMMVGGGIRSARQAAQALEAGADIVVVGTSLEQNPEGMQELLSVFQPYYDRHLQE